MDRSMTSYELRASLRQRDELIQRLKQEITDLAAKVKQLEKWNIQWQTRRWDLELAKQCHAISKEFSKLSEPETKIMKYLLNPTGDRHVRAISKAISISLATTHYNIQKLVQKKLIRCYSRNSNQKKYYCLPESKLFLK